MATKFGRQPLDTDYVLIRTNVLHNVECHYARRHSCGKISKFGFFPTVRIIDNIDYLTAAQKVKIRISNIFGITKITRSTSRRLCTLNAMSNDRIMCTIKWPHTPVTKSQTAAGCRDAPATPSCSSRLCALSSLASASAS